MSVQVRALLYYVRRYVAAHPKSRTRLLAAIRKRLRVKDPRPSVWRHVNLKVEPSASALLVYLAFLLAERAIKPDRKGLFVYLHPELLKK